MKYKLIFWGIVAVVAYIAISDTASAIEKGIVSPPAGAAPGAPRTFWQSVNDLSYNILFGWWLQPGKPSAQ